MNRIGVEIGMDLELHDQHYYVPSQHLVVETELYRLFLEDQGVAIPVRSRDERWEGFILLGRVSIAADALVHSPKGAIGRVINRASDEVIILGKPIDADWETVPQDLQKPQHTQRAVDLVDEFHRVTGRHFHIGYHCDDDTLDKAHHLIVVPHSSSEKSLWVIGSKKNELVVIDGTEVLVRKNDKLVYVSGPNGTVEITGENKTLSVGGPGGITFNCNGEDVTLSNFLGNLLHKIEDSFSSRSGRYT
ncbi:MAG: hypothetical protein ACXAEI_04465 [Candidatus Hodarchaeales archaeon]|jgi:hypothetical protein